MYLGAYRGENPSVTTDAHCFLDWIAEQYGLTLPDTYQKKATCSQSRGDRLDVNKTVCMTNFGIHCDFSLKDSRGKVVDSCFLLSPYEGSAFNENLCLINLNGATRSACCANNCVGVDPNAIIGAGVAAVTATGLGAIGAITPMLGFGSLLLGALGIGVAGIGGSLQPRS